MYMHTYMCIAKAICWATLTHTHTQPTNDRKEYKECTEDADTPSSEKGRHHRRGHRQQQTTTQRTPVPLTPPAKPTESNVHLNEGPSINQRDYSRDKALMSSKEGLAEQPDAFGGSVSSSDAFARNEEQQSVSSTK